MAKKLARWLNPEWPSAAAAAADVEPEAGVKASKRVRRKKRSRKIRG